MRKPQLRELIWLLIGIVAVLGIAITVVALGSCLGAEEWWRCWLGGPRLIWIWR